MEVTVYHRNRSYAAGVGCSPHFAAHGVVASCVVDVELVSRCVVDATLLSVMGPIPSNTNHTQGRLLGEHSLQCN